MYLKIYLGLNFTPALFTFCPAQSTLFQAHIINVFVQGVFFFRSKLKIKSKIYIRFIRMTMNLTLVIIDQCHYCPSLVECIIVLLEPTIMDKSC